MKQEKQDKSNSMNYFYNVILASYSRIIYMNKNIRINR